MSTLSPRSGAFTTKRLLGALLCLGLMWFYWTAAAEHGRRVNTSKARGDQSGYLWDAENVYANWHGRQPPTLIGERNRMPLYAGYLALFYHAGLSDPEFFEVAKKANIALSLGELVLLGLIFKRHLPAHAAVNLLGIVAFGFFIYKAGYAQSELLFCFLIFATFLGCWHLLGPVRGWRSAALAALTGALAGLAHLTKAAMLPFVAVFLAIYVGRLVWSVVGQGHRAPPRAEGAVWQVLSAALFAIVFLAVLWPYLSTSKRVFGHYFYNVNSTFYVWYDDWAHASTGTYVHGDAVGWPTMPESDLPSASRYWKQHTASQIAARLWSGFGDMAQKSYQMFGYLPYLLLCCGVALWAAVTRPAAIRAAVRGQLWRVAFCALYGGIFLLAIAFYYPTSGTGTGRFVVAHLTPLFFAITSLLSSRPMLRVKWAAGQRRIGLQAFHTTVTVVLAIDVTLRLWPRLMTTYGGF